MKKAIITLLIGMLATLLSQTYGQPPAGSKRIFLEDFGGKGASYPTVATLDTIPHTWSTTCKFVGPGVGSGTNGAAGDNEYQLAKHITTVPTSSVKGGIAYAAWWSDSYPPAFQERTFQSDPTQQQGYMMVINASATPSVFFRYTIHNLCPNTHLYFSAYVGNLIRGDAEASAYATRANPSLRFVILDPAAAAPNDTLATSDTISILKDTQPLWHECGFEFTNGITDAITLLIYNATPSSDGNDLVLDDIEIWLSLPVLNVSGSAYYCPGDHMNLTATYDDPKETFGRNPKIKWLYSENANDDILNWDSVEVGATYTKPVVPGFYRAVVGDADNIDSNNYDCCSISDPMEVSFITETTLYWMPQAGSQNWNDPHNWQFPNGDPSPYAPSKCTDVHIPGNSGQYPSLDVATSGPYCACRDIWFHFGGLVGQPQLLDYHRSYVQYNFGMSNGANGDVHNGGIISADPMKRNQWHALAAPLQKMASGDFGVGGFPSMWQECFITSPQMGPPEIGSNGTLDTYWYVPENTNSWYINEQNNAIAVWADGDPNIQYVTTGYQQNLDGLKGILEIPYYENPTVSAFHRGFSQSGTVSSFQYYYGDRTGFPLANKFGYIDRGSDDEAYRFIFEGSPFTKTAEGIYAMAYQTFGDVIMVGNPFMSNLDFDGLAADNSLDAYYLYVDNSFDAYSYIAGSATDMQYIAPLQAFFIKMPASKTVLTFNATNLAFADPANIQLRASNNRGRKRVDVLYLMASSMAGESRLTLSMQNVKAKNVELLLPQGYSDIPRLYATDDTGQKNCIQFEGGDVNEIPFGILSSDSIHPITITAINRENLNVKNLVLWDKYLNNKIDLETTDSYTFMNVPDVEGRFLLMMDNEAATGIFPVEKDGTVYAGASYNRLFVGATSVIANVSVITLQGITVFKEKDIQQTSYTKTLQLPSGLYLVSVKLKTGETKMAKIRIK